MAEYRTIKMSFWVDPFVEELEAEEKLLYLYLFTCPLTNNLGIMEISRKRIAFETGLTANTVQKGLDRLETAGKIIVDGSYIFLTRFIKNQTTTSPKIIESLKSMFDEVPSKRLQHEICLLYPHVFEGCDKSPIPSDNGMDGVSVPSEYPMDTVSIPSDNGMDGVCIGSGEYGSRNIKREDGIKKEERECAPAHTRTREKSTPSDQKIPFGEYGKVKLFQREYDRLCEKYGQDKTDEAIAFLDLHIQSKGKDPYKDHCAALQKWVFSAVMEQKAKDARNAPEPAFTLINPRRGRNA